MASQTHKAASPLARRRFRLREQAGSDPFAAVVATHVKPIEFEAFIVASKLVLRRIDGPVVLWGSSSQPRLAQACRVPGRALTTAQQQQVWDHLHSERFADQAPAAIVAILLDEGQSLCSVSTMYRLLRSRNQVQARRRQRAPSTASRPELLVDLGGRRAIPDRIPAMTIPSRKATSKR